MSALILQKTFELVECCNCHIDFALPSSLASDRRRDHKLFYCPNGHSQYFPGESDIEKAERLRANAAKRTEWAEARATALADQLGATERSLAGHKAAKTRLKNRIAAGVCPCCNRSFQNVAAHMAGQHPGFAHDEKDHA